MPVFELFEASCIAFARTYGGYEFNAAASAGSIHLQHKNVVLLVTITIFSALSKLSTPANVSAVYSPRLSPAVTVLSNRECGAGRSGAFGNRENRRVKLQSVHAANNTLSEGGE